jgi:hypothetical protein
MKSFVRNWQRQWWAPVAIALFTVTVMFVARATTELIYLPIYALMAIHYGKKWKREGFKALLGANRSKGSR